MKNKYIIACKTIHIQVKIGTKWDKKRPISSAKPESYILENATGKVFNFHRSVKSILAY